MRDGMRIGELATRFGLNPKTIRYYEEIGLLPRAERSDSGYRLYDEHDVERLGFIRRAKTLGLSLDEIRDILSVQEGKARRLVVRCLTSSIGRFGRLTSGLPTSWLFARSSRLCEQPGPTRSRVPNVLQLLPASAPSLSSRPR
jgi:DNA-binding transcriptional MerR regulator